MMVMGRLLCPGRAQCGGVAVGGAAAEDAFAESEAPLAPRVVGLGGRTVQMVRGADRALQPINTQCNCTMLDRCVSGFDGTVSIVTHLYHAFRGTNVCTFVPRISSAPFSWEVIA
jgi:hypothetical protein